MKYLKDMKKMLLAKKEVYVLELVSYIVVWGATIAFLLANGQ